MAGIERGTPSGETPPHQPRQPNQTQPQLGSTLSRAVEQESALYRRPEWVFLPLGEVGQTLPSLSKLKGEQWPQPEPQEHANPKAESGLSKLLEEKGLFMADAPERRDPQSYPIEAMKQIQSELTERIEAADPILKDKMFSLRESARKVERAFEIIVYPVLQDQEPALLR